MAKAGRGDDQYMLRFPPGLRDRVKDAAAEHGRSMNSEIVARLEETFGREADGVRAVWLTPELWERIEHEAHVTEVDPNQIILDAVEKAFPPRLNVADRLHALTQDIFRRGLEHTAEGRELLATVEKLTSRERPRRPWDKD